MLDHEVTDDHLEVVQGTIEIDHEVVGDESKASKFGGQMEFWLPRFEFNA